MSVPNLDQLLGQHAATKAEEYRDLVKERFRPGSRRDFAAVIAYAVEHCGLEDTQLADEFGAAVATIRRWISGTTAPAKHSRKLIAERIAELAVQQAHLAHPSITVNLSDEDALSKVAELDSKATQSR